METAACIDHHTHLAALVKAELGNIKGQFCHKIQNITTREQAEIILGEMSDTMLNRIVKALDTEPDAWQRGREVVRGLHSLEITELELRGGP